MMQPCASANCASEPALPALMKPLLDGNFVHNQGIIVEISDDRGASSACGPVVGHATTASGVSPLDAIKRASKGVASGGYGFLTKLSDMMSNRRAGREFMSVEEGERPLQPRQRALQHHEARARHLAGGGEIHPAGRFAQFDVIARLEAEIALAADGEALAGDGGGLREQLRASGVRRRRAGSGSRIRWG
mgnify:CR=1 FL=1